VSARPWAPKPKAGDIVQCRFPESKVGTPGPKDRPGLVIEVEESPEDESASIVRVAYGTSQDVEHRYAGEFTVRATDARAEKPAFSSALAQTAILQWGSGSCMH